MWSRTPREFEALREVYEDPRKRWAIQSAMYANVHYRAKGSPAWEEDDFLGRGDRAARSWKAMIAAREVAQENARLADILADSPPDNLPAWAVN